MPPIPPARQRVVEVIADLGIGQSPRWRYGSGLLIGGRQLLTSAHVVVDAVEVTIRWPDKSSLPAVLENALIGEPDARRLDMALLDVPGADDLPPVPLALIDRTVPISARIEGCAVVGYPQWAEIHRDPHGLSIRETAQVLGHIPPLSGLAEGLLSLEVTATPRPLPGDVTALAESEWSGMSGAAVFAPDPSRNGGEVLVGVVAEHSPRRGQQNITVLPFDRLTDRATGPRNAEEWWRRLGVADPVNLPTISGRNLIGAASTASIQSDPIWPIWGRVLGRLSNRAAAWLISSNVLSAPTLYRSEQAYLNWFMSENEPKNKGDLTYIPLDALPDPFASRAQEWLPPDNQRDGVRHIRQLLWLVAGNVRGGDGAFPQPTVDRTSKLVKDAARFLERVRAPVILLGDPGSGKSTTLREVGITVARRSLSRVTGLIPIYVPLGRYQRTFDDDKPGDILRLVQQSVPASHSALRDSIHQLIPGRRLLILFDGMDEMERTVYAQRVQRLSEFAADYNGQIQTVFACRTNDFLPSFSYRQIVLLPFTRRQVLRYIRLNFELPIIIDGTVHYARKLTQKLFSSPQLAGEVTNPLTLYLARYFISRHKRWPEGRNELFDFYLTSVAQRLKTHLQMVGGPLPDEVEVISSLTDLAFETARESGGVYIQMMILRGLWGKVRADSVVEWGLRSGLLNVHYSDQGDHFSSENQQIEYQVEDKDSIGFFHHRIQEFLCAKHLMTRFDDERSLDWKILIDSPRWQETLLHLAAVRGAEVGAMRFLEETLDEVFETYSGIQTHIKMLRKTIAENEKELATYSADTSSEQDTANSRKQISDEEKEARRHQIGETNKRLEAELRGLRWSVPPERESILADRVVLAARLLGEPRPTDIRSNKSLENKLMRAVNWMASWGRPTSQVKMIWSWKLASNLIPVDAIRASTRSEIGWVRDQSIQAIAFLSTTRKIGASNLVEELSFDFTSSTLLRRAKAYLKAVEGDWRGGLIFFAVAIAYSLYGSLSCGINIAYAWLITNGLPTIWLGTISDTLHVTTWCTVVLLTVLPTMITLACLPIVFDAFVRAHTYITGLCCGVLLYLILVRGFPIHFFAWNFQVHDEIFSSPIFPMSLLPFILPSVMKITSFVMFLGAGLHLAGRLCKPSRRGNIGAALKNAHFGGDICFFVITGFLAIVWALGNTADYAETFISSHFHFLVTLAVRIFAVVSLAIVAVGLTAFVIFGISEIRANSSNIFANLPNTVGNIVLILIACIAGASALTGLLYGISWLLSAPRRGGVFIVCGAVALGLCFWVWTRYAYWIMRLMVGKYLHRFVFQSPSSFSDENWLKQLQIAHPYVQAYMLLALEHSHLLGTEEEVRKLLTRAESYILKEPALTPYWRRRHELEEAVKQNRVGTV
jgi:hypothetical protein